MVNHLDHSVRVANLSYRLALLLELPRSKFKDIYQSGLIHDLGKTKIDPDILNKPGKLTPKEFSYIKKHSVYSYQIALDLGFKENIAINTLYHHENFDGTGYPEGIKGEDIPLGSRIIRICDVYDALTSDRPYKKKIDVYNAIKIMINEKENFDAKLFNVFFKNIKDLEVMKFDIQKV